MATQTWLLALVLLPISYWPPSPLTSAESLHFSGISLPHPYKKVLHLCFSNFLWKGTSSQVDTLTKYNRNTLGCHSNVKIALKVSRHLLLISVLVLCASTGPGSRLHFEWHWLSLLKLRLLWRLNDGFANDLPPSFIWFCSVIQLASVSQLPSSWATETKILGMSYSEERCYSQQIRKSSGIVHPSVGHWQLTKNTEDAFLAE